MSLRNLEGGWIWREVVESMGRIAGIKVVVVGGGGLRREWACVRLSVLPCHLWTCGSSCACVCPAQRLCILVLSLNGCSPSSQCGLCTSADYYRCSYYPLAIVQWNVLPEWVVCLPTLDGFKEAVGKLHQSRA